MSQHAEGAVVGLTAELTDHDGITLVSVAGEVDRMTPESPMLKAAAAVREKPAGVVVDLDAVTFFGSAGVNMLAAVWQEAEAAGVPLAVVATRRAVRMPLTISGVDVLLELYSSRSDAVAAIKAMPRPSRS
ncbi:anti-anti-sigma factor [Lentzea fradiae]|uniref:Anti-anti-sigma factor n=1 Tax=Lentzea fradiae TaxID=200378 RepID=A0A1G7NLJ3_9PSEU|nr:STAS domain-containing protein [Lentzea fradiae]SDF74928.1 anti-anti-sigma factor [Lentzea fradiae]